MESFEFKTAITFACVDMFVGLVVILVCIPLYRGTVKMNRSYGFRCRRAFESEENWYRINRFGAGATICWGVFAIVVGIFCLFLPPHLAGNIAKAVLLALIIPLGLTSYYGRQL